MSLVRWGIGGSELYIYETAEFPERIVYHCCHCPLAPAETRGDHVGYWRLPLHLLRHRAHGHVAPYRSILAAWALHEMSVSVWLYVALGVRLPSYNPPYGVPRGPSWRSLIGHGY